MKKVMIFSAALVGFVLLSMGIIFAQETLRLAANGNVGIGTENPESKLEVAGDVKAQGRIKDQTGYLSPVGSIMIFAGTTPPEGWLFCDGSRLPVSGYEDLYGVIGTIYNYGHSVAGGYFYLPDMRGLFVRGWNPESGGYNPDNKNSDSSYRSFGEVQDDALQDFNATVSWQDYGNAGSVTSTVESYPRISGDPHYSSTSSVMKDVQINGIRTADETRPRNIAMNYIIKY